MNTQVGKSTGIALLMAAAMLAALFAMGVFSTTGVGAHEPEEDDTVSTTPHDRNADAAGYVGPHDELSALTLNANARVNADGTGTLVGSAGTDVIDIDDFDADMHDYSVDVMPQWSSFVLVVTGDSTAPNVVDENEVTVEVDGTEVDAEKETLNADNQGPVAYVIDLTDGVVNEIEVTANNTEEDSPQGPGTYTITLNHDSPTNSNSAGDDIRLTLTAMLRAGVDDEISISLGGVVKVI